MTLARRDNLLLPVIAEPVVWPFWATVMILEGFTHGGEGPRVEFVQIAAAETKAGRHVWGLLSPEERQHGLQAMFFWCKILGCWDDHSGTTST
jgi:hypothetical protein